MRANWLSTVDWGFNGVKRERILIPRAAIREGFEGARSLSHPSENISESTISYDLMFNWQDRIILDPKILAGKPVIKGTRLAVELIIDLLANGWTETDILKNYPRLSHEDISACFSYANYSIRSS